MQILYLLKKGKLFMKINKDIFKNLFQQIILLLYQKNQMIKI